MYKSVVIQIVLAVWLAFSNVNLAASAPRECLEAIQQAIDIGDAKRFEELVDVNKILNDGFDSFFVEASKPENLEKMPPLVNLLLSGFKGLSGNLRQSIINEAAAFVHNGIASGAFGGTATKSIEKQGFLVPLFANASMGRKEIQFLGNENHLLVEDEASFMIHDYGNGNNYPVVGLFTNEPDGYCLVKVNNFPEIIGRIIEEANQ